MIDINLLSLNVRGMREGKKRRELFSWLKKYHKGSDSFILLQETHSNETDEVLWQKEWGSKILFCHGTNHSRGVAILFPHKMNVIINKYSCDINGRRQTAHLLYEESNICIINIYAPTQDQIDEQSTFIQALYDELRTVDLQNTVIGGDFNLYLNGKLDKYMGTEYLSKVSNEMIMMLDQLDLVDIWRVRNPDTHRYTWRRSHPLTQSRLDYWLIPQELIYSVEICDIKPSIKTDHSLITLKIKSPQNEKRGPGIWKFNESLLNDIQFVNELKELITIILNDLKEMEDKSMKWEMIKMEIRKKCISYSKEKAHLTTMFEKEMLYRYENLNIMIDSGNSTVEVLEQFKVTKQEIENINAYRTEGARIRAKAQEIEEGEKCTSYFLRTEHRNYCVKNVTKLYTPDGNIVTGGQEIRKVQTTFYKKLYEEHDRADEFDNYFLKDLPKLSEKEIKVCQDIISLEECTNAVKLMKRGKSPGSDGLTSDFYKFFWIDIQIAVFESLIYGFNCSKLSVEQRRGILRLLPKKGKDITHIQNWRPISLLNSDYKILAAVLANRLQKVLPSVISSDQNGYLKGRFIGLNIRTIFDAIEMGANTDNLFLAFLDFEKAFDTLDRSFLDKCLCSYSFPDYFRQWISIMYTDIESSIINNGFTSEYFPLKRGVRQGCPLSALLFIIVVEALAHAIRENKNIRGIHLNGLDTKVTQLADDTTLILKDILSLQFSMNLLNMFFQASGLKLNQGKTEVLVVGQKAKFYTNMNPYRLKWVKEKIYALGTWFYKDSNRNIFENNNSKLTKLVDTLQYWRGRKLTWFGKVTVIKSKLLAMLNYTISTVESPKEFVDEVQKLMNEFLWDNKTAKIKFTSAIAEKQHGGIGLTHVECYVKAQKISWVNKLQSNSSHFIVKRLKTFLPRMELNDFLKCDYNPYSLPIDIPNFYRQILHAWFGFKKRPSALNEILHSSIWFNQYIIVENLMLWKPLWHSKGISSVHHLLNLNGCFLTYEEFNVKYNVKSSFIEYAGILAAIPHDWKNVIKKATHDLIVINITRGAKIEQCTSKYMYLDLVSLVRKAPTCINSWNKQYLISLNDVDWKKIFMLPWNTISNHKIIEFQYKIIHKVFASNSHVNRFDKSVSEKCVLCNVKDNTVHFFFECIKAVNFWKDFQIWIGKISDVKVLSLVDVLFGLFETNNKLANFSILHAKWFMFREHQSARSLDCYVPQISHFINYLKNTLIVEEACFELKGQVNKFNDIFVKI